MNENIIVPTPPPPPLHPLLANRNRGRGRPDSNNRKNSDKGVFCWGFCNYIFLRFKRVETFIGEGGGGATFYYYYFFFFFLGGGVGGANPYFYRNLFNL